MLRRRSSAKPWRWLLPLAVIVGAVIWWQTIGAPPQPLATETAEANREVMPPDSSQEIVVIEPLPIIVQADSTPTITPFSGVAALFIPRLERSAPIFTSRLSQGSWDVSLIGQNVGHLQGTSELNEPGNIVLAAHVELRDGRPGAFFGLERLQQGDELALFLDGQVRRFRISRIYSTVPTDLNPIRPTSTNRLTLITCDDYDFISNSYNSRIIVVADEII
ncbi:MAG: sortase [Anaerolineae bacterium]|nr:sortase [Anaerolineae bacterium]MDW8173378.1 sortase [Anaerolineae bacterium]